MPIVEIEEVRGVLTKLGLFCRECYNGELTARNTVLVCKDEIDECKDERLYICDVCKKSL